MAVKIVIRPHPKSHPFTERECYVNPHEQVKVGRSVAKVKAASNNFIFDCKVLSRNHAVIWLDDGQFYIKDTKSSNGTFVNSLRLSRTGEESAPVPLRDGDIVQFGVDVTENQNRSVTHGCVITTFHCDLDVKKSGNIAQDPMVDVSARELDELARILIETKQHQEVLEMRLSSVQGDINETKSETQQGLKTFMDGDELLSRIEMMENQLLFYTQDLTEECMHKKLSAETEKRHQEMSKSKDNVRRVLQEKLDLSCKLSDSKRECEQHQQEAERKGTLYEESQKELKVLADTSRQRLTEMEDLRTQLNSMEERHSVLEQKASEDRTALRTQLAELKEEHERLIEERDRLSGANEAYKETQDTIAEENIALRIEISSLKLQLEAAMEAKSVLHVSEKAKLDELEEDVETLTVKSEELSQKLKQAQETKAELQSLSDARVQELASLQRDVDEKAEQISTLERQLKQQAASASSPLHTLVLNNGIAPSRGSVGSDDVIKRLPTLNDDEDEPSDGSFSPSSTSSPTGIATTRSHPEIALRQQSQLVVDDSGGSLKDMRMSMALRINNSSPAQIATMRQNLSDSRKFISRLQHEKKVLESEKKKLEGSVVETEGRHAEEQHSLKQQLVSSSDNCRSLQAQFDNQSAEIVELRRTVADNMLRLRHTAENTEDSQSSSKKHPSRIVVQKNHFVLYCCGAFVAGLVFAYLVFGG